MTASLLKNQERAKRWQQFVQDINPELPALTLRLMEEMRLVSHAIMQVGQNSLAESGLSYAQYRVLMSLYIAETFDGCDDLNPSEISAMQGTSRNTISALIRGLEEQTLIERHLDKQDRRKFNISLTEAGRNMVRENARRHMAVVGRTFAALTTAEQETLSQLLIKLGNHIEN